MYRITKMLNTSMEIVKKINQIANKERGPLTIALLVILILTCSDVVIKAMLVNIYFTHF